MPKFLFIEHNKPGMEWLDKDESPSFSLVEAASAELALSKYVTTLSRYLSEESIANEVPSDPTEDCFIGVELKMYQITKDLSSLPLKWLHSVIKETQNNLSSSPIEELETNFF